MWHVMENPLALKVMYSSPGGLEMWHVMENPLALKVMYCARGGLATLAPGSLRSPRARYARRGGLATLAAAGSLRSPLRA